MIALGVTHRHKRLSTRAFARAATATLASQDFLVVSWRQPEQMLDDPVLLARAMDYLRKHTQEGTDNAGPL